MTMGVDTPGLSVPAHEQGVVRLFAMDAEDPALAAVLPPHPLDAGHLAPLLGVETIQDEDAERVAIRDLADFTLSEFLRIGHDIRGADLAPVAETLDALKGHVLLLHSTAFAGAAARLSPVPGLRFLGAFRRNEASPAPLSLPESERPEILSPGPSAPAPRRRTSLWAVIILVMLAVTLLIERSLR